MSIEEQIMSKGKYPCILIFKPNGNYCLIILQIYFATRAVFKIGEYPLTFTSFRRKIFGHVMRLNQSRASENI